MTKSDFILECIDKVFSINVSSNFIIENYTNKYYPEFYKYLFDQYCELSKQYDAIFENNSLSENEKNARLHYSINCARNDNIDKVLNSFNTILQRNNVKYDIFQAFDDIIKNNKENSKIPDVFNELLIEIRKAEENN